MTVERPLRPGVFLRRLNRFAALVHLDGRPLPVHLPNSGRLGELLTPGRPVLVAARELAPSGLERRTAGDLVFMLGPSSWVSVDARLPGRLVAEAVRRGRLCGLAGWRVEQLEYRPPYSPESRLDLLLSGDRGAVAVETKSVTLVDEDGTALFPDAPTLRGQRHLQVLQRALAFGQRAWVVFVVQRPDALRFSPHRQADPQFARLLVQAHRHGVEVYAYTCRVRPPRIELERPIPVLLEPGLRGGSAS